MNDLNAELNAQVHALARLIGRKLNYERFDLLEEATPLIQALVRDGYSRLSDVNLQVRVESGVLDEFTDIAIHRRGEISSIAAEFQTKLDELVKWQTNQPSNPTPPTAANISSFTDS